MERSDHLGHHGHHGHHDHHDHHDQYGHASHPVHCCPCGESPPTDPAGVSRRAFLGGLGGVALTGLTWRSVSAAGPEVPSPPGRRALRVQPVFTYSTYRPVPQRSWRPWGGVQTEDDARKEEQRIRGELAAIEKGADFPLEMLPLASVRSGGEVKALEGAKQADVLLVFASNGGNAIHELGKMGKDVIFFVRHRSGPVYLWYEIISPRYLRAHTDELKTQGIDFEDVVVDELDDVVWRLRALCGLHNTRGMRILAVGGPGGWAQPAGEVPARARDRFGLDIRTVSYEDLGGLIRAAMDDPAAVALARQRADAYLKLPATRLDTTREFVDNAFLLENVFRHLMAKAECRAITINGCMGTIMPLSKTSACLSLSTLNDDGYLAYCESDFVVIPSGLLLTNITGLPAFLQDPTYPHHGVITLAHCTGPRKMDGKTLEPARIMTHFESDYGAAPKVDMRIGQKLSMIAPDFKFERWLGLSGRIVGHPLLPICRSQIDVAFDADTGRVAERMPGFHWMLVYGDCLRETGYALKRTGIEWENLG